jgi:hypothetical protein
MHKDSVPDMGFIVLMKFARSAAEGVEVHLGFPQNHEDLMPIFGQYSDCLSLRCSHGKFR